MKQWHLAITLPLYILCFLLLGCPAVLKLLNSPTAICVVGMVYDVCLACVLESAKTACYPLLEDYNACSGFVLSITLGFYYVSRETLIALIGFIKA